MLGINSFTIHVNTIGHEVQHGIRMNSNTSELFLVGGVKRVEGDGNLVSFGGLQGGFPLPTYVLF